MQTEPQFVVRLLAVALLDVGAVLLANYAARGQRFSSELDAVITQAILATLPATTWVSQRCRAACLVISLSAACLRRQWSRP